MSADEGFNHEGGGTVYKVNGAKVAAIGGAAEMYVEQFNMRNACMLELIRQRREVGSLLAGAKCRDDVREAKRLAKEYKRVDEMVEQAEHDRNEIAFWLCVSTGLVVDEV